MIELMILGKGVGAVWVDNQREDGGAACILAGVLVTGQGDRNRRAVRRQMTPQQRTAGREVVDRGDRARRIGEIVGGYGASGNVRAAGKRGFINRRFRVSNYRNGVDVGHRGGQVGLRRVAVVIAQRVAEDVVARAGVVGGVGIVAGRIDHQRPMGRSDGDGAGGGNRVGGAVVDDLGHRVRNVLRKSVVAGDIAGRGVVGRERVVGGDRRVVEHVDGDDAVGRVAVGIGRGNGEVERDRVVRVVRIGVIQFMKLGEGVGTIGIHDQREDGGAVCVLTGVGVARERHRDRGSVRGQVSACKRAAGREGAGRRERAGGVELVVDRHAAVNDVRTGRKAGVVDRGLRIADDRRGVDKGDQEAFDVEVGVVGQGDFLVRQMRFFVVDTHGDNERTVIAARRGDFEIGEVSRVYSPDTARERAVVKREASRDAGERRGGQNLGAVGIGHGRVDIKRQRHVIRAGNVDDGQIGLVGDSVDDDVHIFFDDFCRAGANIGCHHRDVQRRVGRLCNIRIRVVRRDQHGAALIGVPLGQGDGIGVGRGIISAAARSADIDGPAGRDARNGDRQGLTGRVGAGTRDLQIHRRIFIGIGIVRGQGRRGQRNSSGRDDRRPFLQRRQAEGERGHTDRADRRKRADRHRVDRGVEAVATATRGRGGGAGRRFDLGEFFGRNIGLRHLNGLFNRDVLGSVRFLASRGFDRLDLFGGRDVEDVDQLGRGNDRAVGKRHLRRQGRTVDFGVIMQGKLGAVFEGDDKVGAMLIDSGHFLHVEAEGVGLALLQGEFGLGQRALRLKDGEVGDCVLREGVRKAHGDLLQVHDRTVAQSDVSEREVVLRLREVGDGQRRAIVEGQQHAAVAQQFHRADVFDPEVERGRLILREFDHHVRAHAGLLDDVTGRVGIALLNAGAVFHLSHPLVYVAGKSRFCNPNIRKMQYLLSRKRIIFMGRLTPCQ